MLKIGDLVKVVSKTLCNGEVRELYPLGTIATVAEVYIDDETGEAYYEVRKDGDTCGWCYLENELEKGSLVWVPDAMQEAIKCIGVWHGEYRLYYDGRHKEFFVLTPNFKITKAPRRISNELADWCNSQMQKMRINK